MTTPYQTIYDAFLAKIRDSIYCIMEEDEREIELLSLLNQAIPLFLYPKINLENKDDQSSLFHEELNNTEIQILAELMKVCWISQKINDEDLIRQQFSDRDYNLTSQASHLRSLILLKSQTEIAAKKMQQDYVKVYNRAPDFSGLAGS